jgi:hypothetical protein
VKPLRLGILPGLRWSGTLTVLERNTDGRYVVAFDAKNRGGTRCVDRTVLSSAQLAEWTGYEAPPSRGVPMVDPSTPTTVRAESRDVSCEWCTCVPATRYRRVRGSALDHIDLCDGCAKGLRAAVSRVLHDASHDDGCEEAAE